MRDFLRMVAAELARLQERERYLEHELRALRQQRANLPTELDDEAIAKLLGEETARIVHVARESSNAIRIKAEEAAERRSARRREAAQQLREDAEPEAAQRLSDAHADAEAELAMAKQQGREMVEEARAYRERALGELARRRDLARQQIEQLVHGRDRLVQAFERARLVAVDVVAELTPLGELDEYVNLSPTTGPVPMMVPKSRLGDVSSIGTTHCASRPRPRREAAAEASDDPIATTPDPSVAVTDEAATPVDHPSVEAPPATPLPSAKVLAFPGASRRATTVPADDEADEDDADGPAPTDERDDGDDRDDADRPDGEPTADVVSTTCSPGCAPAAKLVDGLDVDAPDADDETDAVAPNPFERRDEALTPLIVAAPASSSGCSPTSRTRCSTALRRPRAGALGRRPGGDADRPERHATSARSRPR